MRILCRASLGALAVVLEGCITYSHEVTPWLRLNQTSHFTLYADSGSHSGNHAEVERKEGDRWVELPEVGGSAFAFAGGTRVVLGGRLARPEGPSVHIDCDGELRGTPDGAELICVKIIHPWYEDHTKGSVIITRLDRDAREVGRRTVEHPVRLEDCAPWLPPMIPLHPSVPLTPYVTVDADFLGFHAGGVVLAVMCGNNAETYEFGAVKEVRAYALRPDDRWQQLGTLRITEDKFWALHFPRLWNETNGSNIELGRIPHTADGEPRD